MKDSGDQDDKTLPTDDIENYLNQLEKDGKIKSWFRNYTCLDFVLLIDFNNNSSAWIWEHEIKSTSDIDKFVGEHKLNKVFNSTALSYPQRFLIEYAERLHDNYSRTQNETVKIHCSIAAKDMKYILKEIKGKNIPKDFIKRLKQLHKQLVNDGKIITEHQKDIETP